LTAPVANPSRGLALDQSAIDTVVARALEEDLGPAGDVTTERLIDPARRTRADLLLKAEGVVAGLPVAIAAFRALDPDATFDLRARDGERLDGRAAPLPLARIEASARGLLTAERTALNLLGRLSGIATLTRRYVDAVAGTGAVILDTRKTTPGLRVLEKYAVRCGGGTNHRLGLSDAILIKDNHLALGGHRIAQAVEAARRTAPGEAVLAIEVEAESFEDVREALDAGADRILLDNMTVDQIRLCVGSVAGRVPLEASGGITLANVRAVAETGVDFISIGALTHSATALDVSLEVLA
jgi:nicotinate-nucleotide pyrophosphorylase (carboxylating)